MIKNVISGNELLERVPHCPAENDTLKIHLSNGLVLTEENFWKYSTAMIGKVGSGKTSMLDEILVPTIEHAEIHGDNIYIFAAKKSMLKYARPDDIIIQIDSKDKKCCWNIFKDLQLSRNPEITVREVGDILLEDKQSVESFWKDAIGHIFQCVTLMLLHHGETYGIHLDNSVLREFIEDTPVVSDDGNELTWLHMAEMFPECRAFFDYFGMNGGSDQALGILAELRVFANKVFHNAFAEEGGTFSAIETVRKRGQRVFFYYDYAASGHTTLKMYRILLNMMIKESLSNESDHKNYFVFDEFSLLKLNLLEALSFGREAGFRCLAAFQSGQLLTNHYSRQEAETLLSLFPNLITFFVSDSFSRDLMKSRFGNARVQYNYIGLGNKPCQIDAVEPVVSDYDFMKIVKPGNCIMSLPEISSSPFVYYGNKS